MSSFSLPLASLVRSSISSNFGLDLTRFEFSAQSTIFASYYFVFSCVAAYLGVIALLWFIMRNREPLSLKSIAVVHNAFLSLASLVLLVLYIENVFPKFTRFGLLGSICDISVFEDPAFIYFGFLNYLLKFYELLDTVLLVLKKKELTILHIYHHTMTLLLTFVQLRGHTSVQWVPITANLVVHVIMYYYYTLATLGIRSWWKQYLTMLQITQFVIDILFCYVASYYHFFGGADYYCHGTTLAALFGSGLLTSYLWLFIDFFRTTYSTKPAPISTKGRKAATPREKRD